VEWSKGWGKERITIGQSNDGDDDNDDNNNNNNNNNNREGDGLDWRSGIFGIRIGWE